MANIHTTFKRKEVKYKLTEAQYEKFREIVDLHMMPDEYGESTICNIYYDTENFDLIRNSIEKPVYKEKIRLRSYGVPEAGDPVFLEVKKKFRGIVYKRRVILPLEEAYDSLQKERLKEEHGQIGRELSYVLQHYHVKPKVYLAYDRLALQGREDPSLRMTFDFRIRGRLEQLDLASGDDGEFLVKEDTVVMEVKAGDAFPLWLVHALEELQIYPCSFSKYGTLYKKKIIPKLYPTDGILKEAALTSENKSQLS